ncbi:hypothetical protein BC332_01171 [Capsicum chinense]|nr:hypothetical protein BC332_01171 [Capsicum chinense]
MESQKKIRGAVVSSSVVSVHEVNLKVHERVIHSEGESLINRMNDDALIHIIGFLSIKDMARTSVLSRRWRYLWRRSLIPPLNSKENGLGGGLGYTFDLDKTSSIDFCLEGLLMRQVGVGGEDSIKVLTSSELQVESFDFEGLPWDKPLSSIDEM